LLIEIKFHFLCKQASSGHQGSVSASAAAAVQKSSRYSSPNQINPMEQRKDTVVTVLFNINLRDNDSGGMKELLQKEGSK